MPRLIHPVDSKHLNQHWGEDFAGWLADPYGVTRFYQRVYRDRFGLKGHPGTDYAVQPGTPVMAAADGVVEFAGWGKDYPGSQGTVGGGSFTMVLRHNGYRTAYLHLTEFSCVFHAGDKVKQGDVIALSGNTGVGTGPHLHFQYMPDPLNYNDGSWGTRDPRKFLTDYVATAAAGKPTPITPKPTPKKEDDDMPKSFYSGTSQDTKLTPGKWKTLPVTREGYISILNGDQATRTINFVTITAKGLPKGAELHARLVVVDYEKGRETKVWKYFPYREIIGTGGATQGSITVPVNLPDSARYRIRLQVVTYAKGVTIDTVHIDSYTWK